MVLTIVPIRLMVLISLCSESVPDEPVFDCVEDGVEG